MKQFKLLFKLLMSLMVPIIVNVKIRLIQYRRQNFIDEYQEELIRLVGKIFQLRQSIDKSDAADIVARRFLSVQLKSTNVSE